VAVATRAADGAASTIHVSDDIGETWRQVGGLDVAITDLAWMGGGTVPTLLVATDRGLYQLPLLRDAAPVQVVVDAEHPELGFYGVEAFPDERGDWWVAVAAQVERGVYLSGGGGRLDGFRLVGLAGEDTRTLAVQLDGSATWLWAGLGEAAPDQPGRGAMRARLFEADVRWEPAATGWTGGTCWAVAFGTGSAFAATQSAGVLRLDLGTAGAAWQPLEVNAGLPLRDRTRFQPVRTLATGDGSLVLAGGTAGVHRSTDDEHRSWRPCDHRRAQEVVTIPDTWLLCSGAHEIEVVTGRGPRRD
jgi:hypothetical protein